MTIRLQIIIGIVVLAYFLMIVHFIKKKTLALKYTLIWLFAGFAMLILALFPELLNYFVNLVGIKTPMYGLLVFAILFVLAITMLLTAIVSKQTERIKDLAQKNALLEKEIRELKLRDGMVK